MQSVCPRAPALSMAVNVSACQLQRPDFIEEVRAALAESGIPPASLTLELTESVMMQDMELSQLRLKALRGLGVKLAIDDFGTGYSSLNYIRQLPVDILKIDRSFLADPNPEVAELTAAIVQLARIFKLKAVAEGIENHAPARAAARHRLRLRPGLSLRQAARLRGDPGDGHIRARDEHGSAGRAGRRLARVGGSPSRPPPGGGSRGLQYIERSEYSILARRPPEYGIDAGRPRPATCWAGWTVQRTTFKGDREGKGAVDR